MSNVTAIQTTAPASLAPMFSPEQERMILSTFLGGATREEAAVLLEIVKRRRLDPFARQVYFVKRWDSQKREEVWAIQISIDGLRSLAERTGKYDGQDEPEYGKDEAGEYAKVKVYRKDWSSGRAAVGIAYLSEFIQKKRDGTVTAFWQRMPRLMLAKCAEALAIRKAFPEDTAGLYIPEEMGEEPKAAPEALPASGERAAPAPAAERTVEAKPEPRASDKVLGMWDRLVRQEGGNKKMAKALWDKAAESVGAPVKSTEWTPEHAAMVESYLWPKDVA
jgi:phage recombination protein Bet